MNTASKPRNQNHLSLNMFHSFLIMRYLLLKIYSLNQQKNWKFSENELYILWRTSYYYVLPWGPERLEGHTVSLFKVGIQRNSLILFMYWSVTPWVDFSLHNLNSLLILYNKYARVQLLPGRASEKQVGGCQVTAYLAFFKQLQSQPYHVTWQNNIN